jgi:hypothetical protein
MAHAQADPRLAREEVGISQAFAREVLREVRKACPRALEGAKEREGTEEREGVEGVEALNGFPTWTVRFPLANRWGVQALRLRVLPGSGRYLALHPFTLSERFLGDVDGDLILCHLRADEVARGALAVETGLTPLPPPGPLPPLRSRLTLQGILHPEALEIEEKLRAKFQPPDLRTREQRLAAIGAADAREHVAVYTMALGWWVSRVLASLGGKERTAACRAAYELLQFFMEGCMDARKLGEDNAFGAGAASEPVPEGAGKGASGGTTATGFAAASGQPSGGNGFDSYAFMEALFGGGEIRWDELQALGLPEAAAECLEQAWALSGGDLRGACARSPVYWALVLRRERREESVLPMLQALQEQGLPPEALYDAIAGDLACLPGRILSWPEETLLAAGEPCGAGLAGEGDVFSRCDDDPFQD